MQGFQSQLITTPFCYLLKAAWLICLLCKFLRYCLDLIFSRNFICLQGTFLNYFTYQIDSRTLRVVYLIAWLTLFAKSLFLYCFSTAAFGFEFGRFAYPHMASENNPSTVLLLGHSFIRRLKEDLGRQFHSLASQNFGLKDATVCLHGVGGRAVRKYVFMT